MTSFYCFINGNIKKNPKNLDIDINVAKNGQFRIFPWQAANSTASGKFCGTAQKSACRGILLAMIMIQQLADVLIVGSQLNWSGVALDNCVVKVLLMGCDVPAEKIHFL